MMSDDLKSRSVKGLAWAAGEGLGVAFASLVGFVVLARLLSPQDFGIVALATAFIYFCNLLTGHSFADTIVQRSEIDADHLDTAFWSTLGIALTLMAACIVGADAAATLFGEPDLAGAIRWLSVVLPLSALSSIQMAIFRRGMRFDAVARRTLFGRGLGAAAGIAAALLEFGFWSLIIQQLVGQSAMTLAFAMGPWRPRFRFSGARLRTMWAFGAHVSANQIVSGAGEQALNLLVGTLFGATALGYFTLAWRAVNLLRSLVSSAVYQVGLSAFSKLQQDSQALSNAFLNATRISCLVGFPVSIGIAMVSEPLVLTAFDAGWWESIPLLAVLALELIPAFYGMFLSVLYRAMNRPALGLIMALLYGTTGLAGAFLAAPFGLQAVVAVWVLRAFLLMPLHVVLVRRLLAVSAGRLIAPVAAPLASALAMAAGVGALQHVLPQGLAPLGVLVILAASGSVIYVAAIGMLSPRLMGLAFRTAGVAVAPARKSS